MFPTKSLLLCLKLFGQHDLRAILVYGVESVTLFTLSENVDVTLSYQTFVLNFENLMCAPEDSLYFISTLCTKGPARL